MHGWARTGRSGRLITIISSISSPRRRVGDVCLSVILSAQAVPQRRGRSRAEGEAQTDGGASRSQPAAHPPAELRVSVWEYSGATSHLALKDTPTSEASEEKQHPVRARWLMEDAFHPPRWQMRTRKKKMLGFFFCVSQLNRPAIWASCHRPLSPLWQGLENN